MSRKSKGPNQPPELPPLVGNLPRTNVIPRERAQPMRYRLRFVYKSVWYYELTGDEVTIGWGAATIRVPQVGGVSRIHLRLFLRNGRWCFEDVSTNGVWELDAFGIDTGSLARGVDGWLPGRGYRIGNIEVWMELVPSAEEARTGFHGLIGESQAMAGVEKLIRRVGPRDATVILHGESGTGKELVAAAIHELSPRKTREMKSVNCADYEGELVRSALFGHVKGAFTGADREQEGIFDIADGSTLFLDEVAELGPRAQAELLRVLETGKFCRVGGRQVIEVDVRVIVASHQHLGDRVRQGLFRDDLYGRLNVITIRLPPLSERLDDIPALVEHFSRKYDDGRGVKWSKDALAVIKSLPHPHNVRGLRNLVQRTLVLHPEVRVVEPHLLELGTESKPAKSTIAADDPNYIYLPGKKMAEIKAEAVKKAMTRNGGKQVDARKELEISKDTVQRYFRDQMDDEDED